MGTEVKMSPMTALCVARLNREIMPEIYEKARDIFVREGVWIPKEKIPRDLSVEVTNEPGAVIELDTPTSRLIDRWFKKVAAHACQVAMAQWVLEEED